MLHLLVHLNIQAVGHLVILKIHGSENGPTVFLHSFFGAKPCCNFFAARLVICHPDKLGLKKKTRVCICLTKYGSDLPSHNVSASPSFPGLTFHTQALGCKENKHAKKSSLKSN